jgi:hypothetical protein
VISQLSLHTELLLQLALSIGHGDSLHEMATCTAGTMLRLLNASGVLLLRTSDAEENRFPDPRVVAMLPHRLMLHPARRGLARAYPDRRLVHMVAGRALAEPLVLDAGRGVAMVWPLPDFGVLVVFRATALSRELVHALPPVLELLARTARRFALTDDMSVGETDLSRVPAFAG